MTDVAGNSEIVTNNENGFLAAAPTTEQLVDEAMAVPWNRRHELHEMGKRAAEAIRKLIPRDPAAEFADVLLRHLPSTAKASYPDLRSQPQL